MLPYLFLASIIMLACVALHKFSDRLGIPALLAFILLGMFFGTDGVVKIPFDNFVFAEQICSIALIFIIFDGGFGTNWDAARPAAGKSILLSTLGVVMTAGLVGLFCRFALHMAWLEAFLLGAVISSTDAASVFSILRSKRLNLKYNTASLLEVESGSNDPISYMLTVIVLSLMTNTQSQHGTAYLIFAQVVYGLLLGALIAWAATKLLKSVRISSSGMETVLVTAIALLSYLIPTLLGGNGYLSAYVVGIVLGNTELPFKRRLIPFFDGVTSLMQMVLFFMLGLLAFPSKLPSVALPALLVALFLTFVARPIAVFLLLSPLKAKLSQMIAVSWAGFRGVASIVFAISATLLAKPNYDIFHTVFFIVLFSILLQGSLLPPLCKKLGMIDEKEDVMKTFSGYNGEIPVHFIQFIIRRDHAWCGMQIKDLALPPDTLLVFLCRDGKNIVPKGETRLQEGDRLVLSARPSERPEGVNLSEKLITEDSPYAGRPLRESVKGKKALVILIKRGDRVIIPNGDTRLHPGDLLLINRPE
ncbi:MAG: potassium/proton antiporter [Oscillospiraceae bacterium]|nr:potassium/proton antiporter [Oscillospiraceae bacterium]